MSIDTAAPEIRQVKEVGMKLISMDIEFDGTVVEILGYRTDAAGHAEVTAILDSPGAWYSRSYPVVLDAHAVRLLLTMQSVTPTVVRRTGKDHR